MNALGGFWFGKTGSGPTGAIAGTQVISTSTGAYSAPPARGLTCPTTTPK